ncbi:hypothetical protein HA402_011893 [Bradysia odoriphaga]|nr:hypothetical protein HA402_011893 [Bradysia odoriphaga]
MGHCISRGEVAEIEDIPDYTFPNSSEDSGAINESNMSDMQLLQKWSDDVIRHGIVSNYMDRAKAIVGHSTDGNVLSLAWQLIARIHMKTHSYHMAKVAIEKSISLVENETSTAMRGICSMHVAGRKRQLSSSMNRVHCLRGYRFKTYITTQLEQKIEFQILKESYKLCQIRY